MLIRVSNGTNAGTKRPKGTLKRSPWTHECDNSVSVTLVAAWKRCPVCGAKQ